MIIRHNIAALRNLNQLNMQTRKVELNIEKLSSGTSINRAADNSAGLTISEKMRAQIRGLEQAQRNIQDAISLIQTGEGGLASIQSPPLQRLRELAVQAANDTLTNEDREMIQQEVEQIKRDVDDIAHNTLFNGKSILNRTIDISEEAPLSPHVSLDQVIWQEKSSGYNFHANDLIYDDGKYISTGTKWTGNTPNVTVITSTDGVTWTNNSPSIEGESLAIASGDGKYVVVGRDGLIISSTDGINWTQQSSETNENLISITYGNGQFVAVGTREVILTSTDGVSWTQRHKETPPADYIRSVVYNNDIFVAGSNNYMWYSHNGVEWNKGDNLGIGGQNGAIVWDGNRFVASLLNGDIGISTDGVAWSTISTGIEEITSSILSYGNNIALMESNTPNLWFSTDNGDSWTKTTRFADQYQGKLIYNDGQYLTIGINGTVLTGTFPISPETDNPEQTINNTILNIQTGPNSNNSFVIELIDVQTQALGINNIDLSTRGSAEKAINLVDYALERISTERSKFVVYQNRLEHTINNLGTYSENLTAAESRIRDVDYALVA